MLDKIRNFFNTQLLNEEHHQALTDHQRRLTTAALLIEVATIDQEFDSREFSTLINILQQQFQLNEDELTELADLAHQQNREATSLYQFTQLVNQHFSAEEKYHLILSMWHIAYADKVIDKYEEHVIRKVSELIYVSHSDFIRAKVEARPG